MEEEAKELHESESAEDTKSNWKSEVAKGFMGAAATAATGYVGATKFTQNPSVLGGVVGAMAPAAMYGIKKGVDYGMDKRKKNKKRKEFKTKTYEERFLMQEQIKSFKQQLQRNIATYLSMSVIDKDRKYMIQLLKEINAQRDEEESKTHERLQKMSDDVKTKLRKLLFKQTIVN